MSSHNGFWSRATLQHEAIQFDYRYQRRIGSLMRYGLRARGGAGGKGSYREGQWCEEQSLFHVDLPPVVFRVIIFIPRAPVKKRS